MEKSIVKNYIDLFSNLSPDNINEFDDIISEDIIFIDKLNMMFKNVEEIVLKQIKFTTKIS